MKIKHKHIKLARELTDPFRITNGKDFKLDDLDPGDTLWLKSQDKPKAKEALASGVELLAALQDKLYADDRWALLLIFQAMDAAGKDGAIKHVMSGVNPQGCQVTAFKAPSSEELDHDFLWRCSKNLPDRGEIGIFNRSYYEEVLVVRVHPELIPNFCRTKSSRHGLSLPGFGGNATKISGSSNNTSRATASSSASSF